MKQLDRRPGVVSDIRQSLALIGRRDTLILGLVVLAQGALALLDLFGVLMLGLVAAVGTSAIQGTTGQVPGLAILARLGFDTSDPVRLVTVLALVAALALLVKSVASAILTRRVLLFLAQRQKEVSGRLAAMLLQSSLVDVQELSSHQVAYAIGPGMNLATVVLIGQAVMALSEVLLLTALTVLLFIVNPVVAVVALSYFLGLGVLMQSSLGRWSAGLGGVAADTEVSSTQAIHEAMEAFREISVTGRTKHYEDRIRELRARAALVLGRAQFLGQIPKYVLEVALVVGAALLAAYGLFADDKTGAAATLAVFLVAGTRMLPALMRMQGAVLQIREAAGRATPTFELAAFLTSRLTGGASSPTVVGTRRQVTERCRDGEVPTPDIRVEGMSFTYPGGQEPALREVNFYVPTGASLALVGRSGAGKSTLADLILGVLEPDEGSVLLGGLDSRTAISRWPGTMSYVPQDVMLANATVWENVALGLPVESVDLDLVWEALGRAHLGEFIRQLPMGLQTQIGERGTRLSGGQRQRLGLARAFYSRPSVLVMDEATSALDAETEELIARSVLELSGSVTTVTIAHRLATVRNVDQVVYLRNGVQAGSGTFDEIRREFPDFDRQARLLGL